jgi:FKBP-type peptidyl-prolyl cis-trans isomerase FkpA
MKKNILYIVILSICLPIAALAQSKAKNTSKARLEVQWKQGRGSMRYKIYRSKDSIRVKEGALVTLHLAWYGKDLKKPSFDTRTQGAPSVFNTVTSPYHGSLEEGLYMMHKGDSAVFELQSDSMFRYTFNGKLPPEAEGLQKVLVSIKLIDTDPSQTFEEREKQRKKYEEDNEQRKNNENTNIERFLYMNNMMKEPDTCGIWHIIIREGTEAVKPVYGDRVVYKMVGRVLDGSHFEGSPEQPAIKEFTIGRDPVPEGLSKGIQLMNINEKALLIIPSSKGFGNLHMGKLPPYSTLLVEIELTEIKPNKK